MTVQSRHHAPSKHNLAWFAVVSGAERSVNPPRTAGEWTPDTTYSVRECKRFLPPAGTTHQRGQCAASLDICVSLHRTEARTIPCVPATCFPISKFPRRLHVQRAGFWSCGCSVRRGGAAALTRYIASPRPAFRSRTFGRRQWVGGAPRSGAKCFLHDMSTSRDKAFLPGLWPPAGTRRPQAH
ncbi:hypothetical protein C8R47DRAFT_580293 [Mycena vitilis]|nr:hypothetical protein C8R47DRAFT_580293 [Mycena vitilis]